MPSSKGYKRDYRKERLSESKKRKKARSLRTMAARKKKCPKGQSVEHKKPLRKGGTNSAKNLSCKSVSSNSSANGHRRGEKQRRKKK